MKKALMIVSVLVIAVISTACINNIAVQELNNKAAEFMQKGDYESAMNRLQASLDLDATMYETYYNLGVAAINAKKYEKAIEALEGGIKIKPDYAEFYYSLGVAQSDLADEINDEAAQKLEDDTTQVQDINEQNVVMEADKRTDAVEAKNKNEIAKLIADAEAYIKAHYEKEYYQPVCESCKEEKVVAQAKYRDKLAELEKEHQAIISKISDAQEIKDEKYVYKNRQFDAKMEYEKDLQQIKDRKHAAYAHRSHLIDLLRLSKFTFSETMADKWENYQYTFNKRNFLLRNGLYIAIIIVFIILCAITPVIKGVPLLTYNNILNILQQASPRMFLALGVAGLILLLVLKTSYKLAGTNETYKKKEKFFPQSKRDSFINMLSKSPEAADLSDENKGNGLRVDVFYSHKSGKAYCRLYEYIPYRYEPCSPYFEHSIDKVANFIK